MKSKFAKFVDGTLGSCLIFLAATAVFRYFTTLELAVFSGITVTACAILLLHVTGLKNANKQRLSSAAEDMFYEFMFLPDNAPSKLLYKALSLKRDDVKLHGITVYVGKTAAVCMFDSITKKNLARTVSIAKHYGATSAVILCAAPPTEKLDVDGFDVKYVIGNDVYTLFASLAALPEPNYSVKHPRRRNTFAGALDKNKAAKYLVLSACLFFVSIITGYSIIPFACAVISALLFIATIAFNVVKHVKSAAKQSEP